MVAKNTQTVLMDCFSYLNIGCGNTMAMDSFGSGLIDDVRIYNKALSEEQIAALAQ
jgi:hypothetical protein